MDADAAAREDVFNVSTFLKFLFSVLFLFVCCLTLMLYVNKVAAFFITQIMRYFVLPKHTTFYIRGFHIAPLRARIFFQQLFLENENYSIRVVDGYFTFALWNSWLQDTQWTKVHDYMLSPDLIGLRCRVMMGFKTVKGSIREVDLERQKITVELDDGPSWSDEDAEEEEADEEELDSRGDEDGHAHSGAASESDNLNQPDTETQEAVVGLDDGMADHLNRPFETGGRYYSNVGRKNAEARANMRSNLTNGSMQGASAATATRAPASATRRSTAVSSTAIHFNPTRSGGGGQTGGGEKVLKVYDMSDVSIRNRPGRCQLHLNGMRLCLYNATGKYEDLKNSQHTPAQEVLNMNVAQKVAEMSPHVRRLQRFFRRHREEPADLDGDHTDAVRLRARDEALKLQQHQLKRKSFMQKVFDIIHCVEIETSVSSVDVGGVGSSHPYFLHTAFRTGEGRVYLTQSGVPGIDLYRLVAELTLQQVDMRMVPMDNKLTDVQLMRNPTLLERTHLLFRGTADRHNHGKASFLENSVFSDSTEIPDLIRDFGIILDGKDRSDVHIVYFRDVPNVYAGEEVTRGKVPTSSVEVLIDAQRLRYGPWLEYCRTQLWNFFLPPNYRPLQVMEFEIGKPRPVCGFDMFVEFMTNTTLEVPFKRRAPAPSPPFGIKDSKRKGMLSATIGKGSQYIQPAFFMLKGEKKQRLEALFLGKNVNVRANAVLDRDNVQFCTAETVQFFLDREDDMIWNGRKRWNILTHLFNAEVSFYMSYVDFFLDLLNDWQFAQNMYHNVPLTTETFNTLQRAVRDFIPNVKRFEVFADKATFNVNVNSNHVIYSENPNDRDQNSIATLCARRGSFSMILPSDQYQLAAENEVVRPLEACAEDLEVFLSLPKLHPLSAISSSEIRWAYCRRMDIRGSFTSVVPCQSQPVPKDNLNTATGRTRLHNYLNLEVDFTHLKGRLMGQHIKGLVNALQNLFLDNTLPIAPDELFWLLAKLQSHVALGKNKRKEFKQFLESKEPAGNDLEVAVSVTLKDVDAVVCVGQGRRDAALNVATSLLNFSYVKQFAVTDTCVTLSPIVARFIDERGHITQSPNAFICVGDIAVSLVKHFGPMPFKPKVHESMDVKVNGVSFNANVEQLMGLVQAAQVVLEHLKAEDPVMEAEVNEAHSVAEYAADQIGPQALAPQTQGLRRRQNTGGSSTQPGSPASPVGATAVLVELDEPTAVPGGEVTDAQPVPLLEAYEEKGYNARHNQGAFFQRNSTDSGGEGQYHAASPQAPFSLGFADEVSYSVAQEYAAFMERVNKADEASKDYGVFCTLVNVGAVEGAVTVGEAGLWTLYLPWGLTVASSTLNDGNSSNRLSVAARELSLRALVPRDLDAAGATVVPSPLLSGVDPSVLKRYDKYLEVLLVQTSVCLRHYTAYPFDGSLAQHRLKQRNFVRENDYEELIRFAFDEPAVGASRGTDAAAPQRTHNAPSSSSGAPFSPVRPGGGHTQDPPTLARRPVEGEQSHSRPAPTTTVVPSNSEASAAAPSFDAFANALANYSVAGAPLFASTESQSGADESQFPSPHRSALSAPSTVTGKGSPRRGRGGVGDLSGLRRGTAAPSAALHAAVDGDHAAYLRTGSVRSDGSGDTTVHIPGNDLSSLSSVTSDDAGSPFALPEGSFGAANTCCGEADHTNGEAVFASCRSATSSSAFDTSSSSDVFDERVRFYPNGEATDDMNASRSTGDEPTSPRDQNEHTTGPTSGESPEHKKSALLTAVGFEQCCEHQFFCAYFRITPSADDVHTHSLLDYTPMRAARTAPHHEWVHANAPLPSTSFVLYSVPTGFPDYVLAEQFMQTHYTSERDLYDWATRQANNSERAAHQSTTKHLHVEIMEPVQVLLSRQAVCLVESSLVTVREARENVVSALMHGSTVYAQARNPTDFTGVQEQVRKRNAAAFFRPKRTKAKSHARTQQKRWLTEDRIITTVVPCVEVKFISALPVPLENAPRSAGPSRGAAATGHPASQSALPPYGVYSTTLAIRDVQLILAQDRPPAGVVEPRVDVTQKFSASLTVNSLAVINQIEQEPLPREGNLLVEVPNLPYDDLKDTIGVLYMTDLQSRAKQDTVRGANGGACSIAIDTIAFHATREFVDYVRHMKIVLLPHFERIAAKVRTVAATFASSGSLPGSPHSTRPRTGTSAYTAPRAPLIIDRSRTLQGKGSVSRVFVRLVDTRRQGDCIVVDVAHPSSITVSKVSTNFVLVVPNRRPDQPECLHLTTIGEVRAVEVRLYPCLLHCLQPRVDVVDWESLYATSTAAGQGGDGQSPPSPTERAVPHVSFEKKLATPVSAAPSLSPSALGTSGRAPTSTRPAEAPAKPKAGKQWVYNFAFTLRSLDAIVAQSRTNYAQLCGTNLTGGAESRLEPMRSRECVQMEALTEAISPRLKERLRFLAHKARQRAKRSRYAAPPATTAQLQLYSTASFFTQNLVARYVVDAVLHSVADGPPTQTPAAHVAEVFSATVTGISTSCHFSDQYDLLGQQVDVHAIVSKVNVMAPHHAHTEETVNPQLVQFITSWRSAAKKMQASVTTGVSSGYGGHNSTRPPSPAAVSGNGGPSSPRYKPVKAAHNKGIVLRLQVKQMETILGLPQNIQQRFVLPELCLFVRSSSDERVNVKVHAHPFSIDAKASAADNYRVTLPNVYLMYAHDAIKMTSTVIMEPVSITITPSFVNHALLTYEKLTAFIGALVSRSVPLDAQGNVARHAPNPMAAMDGRSILGMSMSTPKVAIKRGRRCSFLFLWQGFHFSYLTSMSNLRFSLRKLNAIGESSQVETRKTLEWTINVTGAQVALVDRDYHDKHSRSVASAEGVRETQTVPTATVSASHISESRASYSACTQAHHPRSVRSTGPSSSAFAPSQGDGQSTTSAIPPVASSTLRTGCTPGAPAQLDPLAGYVWGSVELNFTLSGGKTDRDTVKTALMNTSFGAYTEEMQTALMAKLGATNAWWNLSVGSPLVIVRIGLVPLLNRCFEETRRDISFMKQATNEENQGLKVRLNRHRTFRKLQKEKRRYETLINRNRHEQLEQLKRMTGQVALDLQRRRAGVSQGPGWDSALSDLDISTTHRFVATVTNFMVILPFGDTAFRSVLDELPEVFSCHRTDKHMHRVSCLDRRRFVPTLAFKSKVETTSFICEATSTKSLQIISAPVVATGSGGGTTSTGQSRQATASAFTDAPAGAVVTSHKFVGRFLATDTMLFFSPGVPVDTSAGVAALQALGREPFLLGGDGNLAGSNVCEYQRARNTVHITTIDAPVHVKSTREKASVAVMLDMSGPRVRLSPHFVTLMMELTRELPTRRLRLQLTDAAGAEAAGSTSTNSPPVSPLSRSPTMSVSEIDTTPHHLTVDVSARLEAGDIRLFSYGVQQDDDESPPAPTNAGGGGGRRSSSESVLQRSRFPLRGPRGRDTPESYSARTMARELAPVARGGSAPPASARGDGKPSGSSSTPATFGRRKRLWPAGAASEDTMRCVLQIPLPSVIVQVLVRRSNVPETDDVAAVRGEIHAGVIELGPSLGVVAREIEQTAATHQHNVAERRKGLLALIQELDKIASQMQLVLPVPMHELLLPVPRAYASTVLTDRTHRMATLHRHRKVAGSAPATTAVRAQANHPADGTQSPPLVADLPRRRFVTDVQVTLSGFRLVFSVEPFASTTFTVFLDERGSVDVLCRLVKEYRQPFDALPFVRKDPTMSVIANVRRLRAECQTKLEVKSVEIVLPEAELVVSSREGTVGMVKSVAVNFPFNAEGSVPNLTLRMQHLSQVFMVTKIWTRIVTETKESIVSLARQGAAMKSGATALAHRLGEATSVPDDLGTEKHLMVVMYLSHGIASVDMGSGNAHQLLFGAIRCAVERCLRANGALTYLLQTQVESFQIRSEGVLSGFATLRNVIVQSFLILNAEDSPEFLRSPDERTFRGTVLVQRVHVSFKERQLKDIFECRVGHMMTNVMDGVGIDAFTTSDIDISLSKGTLGVTPSTVPAVLTVLRSVSAVVADQQATAAERITTAVSSALKSAQNGSRTSARRGSSVDTADEPVFSWVAQSRRTSADSTSTTSSPPSRHTEPQSPSSAAGLAHCIAYLGNAIPRVPCGQLTVSLEETQLLLGAISSGQAATGCVVASFERALFSFAETPCDDYTAAKKVLIVETHNAELYRPGAARVTILGFLGDNHFEFYTRQVLGQKDVGFTLTLRQSHPWTGNPRFRDFEEMITLMKSFTDRRNVKAFKQFGHTDLRFHLETGGDAEDDTGALPPFASPRREAEWRASANTAAAAARVANTTIVSEKQVEQDVRVLKALRASKFSPQLRFGGDVSVNTEVILNWLGITEKMLPAVLNGQLCDKLEMALYSLGTHASERVRLVHDPNLPVVSSEDEGDSRVSSPPPAPPL